MQHIRELFLKLKICGFRQTIQQLRDNDESFQYELFKIAQVKGYYKPAGQATVTEIQAVKNELQ